MISFFCLNCGLKLQVKDEFAGRSSRCPTCKQPLVVPPPSQTQADVVAGQIDGTDSSLTKAGIDGGVSLQGTAGPGRKSLQDLLSHRAKKDGRYIIEGEIARGGMGTVLRAIDCDIRREVAVKYLLDQSDTGKKLRFVEEAQITGQLEHPNIVPIHELGMDQLKRLFFSMKMVKGRSLAQVLDELQQRQRIAEKEYSLGRLLNVLVNVCNALAYAHSCGVVHRDLKPANIMIGDFREVYVMDWGLAKVLKGGQIERSAPMATAVTGVSAAAPLAIAVPNQGTSPKPSSKVETSRQVDADLTQEGAVLGTPVYMPPEQATGKVEAIDQRSDVYSLGAILYEMLTLQPPINKEGGYLTILMRVMQGEIVPPEQRNPARAGKIPKEVSAIAMKALAKNPQDRYPNVEALRRDIERFQEGRSVSAKDDTTREMVWKLMKRNKAVSAATLIFVPLLLVLFGLTLKNYLAYASAEKEKDRRTKEAIPALLKAAQFAVEKRDYKNAMEQADLVLTYAPDNADALLLRGQLLIAQQDFAGARKELEKHAKVKPDDSDAKKLAELCQKPRPDDEATSLAFAAMFDRRELYGLEDGVLRRWGKTSVQARSQILVMYTKQIDKHLAGWGRECLRIDTAGLHFGHGGFPHASLEAFQGMPLTTLHLNCPQVRELAPLRGMPLTSLELINCGASDLTPLRGMPLTHLDLTNCGGVQDLEPLRGMPLTSLSLSGTSVADLTPLKEMPLTSLNLSRCRQLGDLTPLRGMKLSSLSLPESGAHDLTPLAGMPLTRLIIAHTRVNDVAPLRGMKLASLNMAECQVRDVTPLQELNLVELSLTPRNITKGLDAIRRMKSLKAMGTTWAEPNFTPAEFWKRYDAGEFK